VDIECFPFSGEAWVAFLIRVSLRGEGDFSVNGRKLLELLRKIGARCGERFDNNPDVLHLYAMQDGAFPEANASGPENLQQK